MKRKHLAWMHGEQIGADAWRALQFEVPLLRWTEQAYREVRDSSWNTHGEPRVRAAIWCLAGELLHWRQDRDQRQHIRLALGLLRRAWLAHCAGRKDLSNDQFKDAWIQRQEAASTPLAAKAGEAWLAEQRRRFTGKAAHGDGPTRTHAAVTRAHNANPRASNYQIAQLTGIPESTVRRHRPKRKT